MKCIIGLGNPGKEYQGTRHNVGFCLIDWLRERWGFSDWKDSRFYGLISEGSIVWEKIVLLKPTTYMNLSGRAVGACIQFYKLDPKEDILVLSDDIDMDFAKIRFREKGSHGGQNGLRSIIEQIGHDMFSRIKVGIWRDDRYSVSDWVLSRFRAEELESLHGEVQDWVDIRIREWIWG